MGPGRTRKTTSSGNLIFLFGHPLSHSFSPRMHNAAFASLGMPWTYIPVDLFKGDLQSFIRLMRILPTQGANVTVPYKEKAIPGLDGVEPVAKRIGAINTIYRRGKKLFGASTDGLGFLLSLGNYGRILRGTTGLLLGAGGAGRSVAFSLASCGIKRLFIANRSVRKAVDLRNDIRKYFPMMELDVLSFKEATSIVKECEWVVQSTSLGLKKEDPSPIDLRMRPRIFAIDLIYHRETEFLKMARRKGCVTLNGLDMLLYQGALSFELWTGKKAPLKAMKKELLKSL